jgi:hypothetical protein
MFYFYINFPTFKSRTILIHRGECGDCQNGIGKHNIGSNEKGFWSGPFKNLDDADSAMKKLQKKFKYPPNIGNCTCV